MLKGASDIQEAERAGIFQPGEGSRVDLTLVYKRMEGVKMKAPDSSQQCPVRGAMGKNQNTENFI